MMNKKGVTLVEVIISVGLISVVMLFLFNLLIDIQYEDAHTSYAKENQINRASIIKTIQQDFIDYSLQDITMTGDDSSKTFTFTFSNTSSKNLVVNRSTISYGGEVWNIETKDEAYFDISKIVLKKFPNYSSDVCTLRYNIDSNGDGVCDINCEKDGNITNRDEHYQVCSDYEFFRVIIPVSTQDLANDIDDIELFYLKRVDS